MTTTRNRRFYPLMMIGAVVLIVFVLLRVPAPYSTGLFVLALAGPPLFVLLKALPVGLQRGLLRGSLLMGWAMLVTVAFVLLSPEPTASGPRPQGKADLLRWELERLPQVDTYPWGEVITLDVAAVISGLLVLVGGVMAIRRREWQAALTLGVFCLMLWAAVRLRPGASAEATGALVLFGVGAAVLTIGAVLGRRSARGVIADARKCAPTRGWSPLVAAYGAMALLVLTGINAVDDTWVPTVVQLALLVLGVVLLVSAFRVRGVTVPTIRADGNLLALLGVLVLAFALRTWDLETLLHRYIDEVASIDSVLDLREDRNLHLLRPFTGIARFTRVYSLWQSWTVEQWGPSLVSLRLISAFVGTVTVAALYRLTRDLFDQRTALVAALLLAVFPPHVHFSRVGINNIVDPLFGVLALTFLVRGIRHGRAVDLAMAGAMLGLTQYFYEGGRLLYPPLVLGLAVLNLRSIRWRGLVTVAGMAAVVAAPAYSTLVLGEYALTPRLEGAGRDASYWRDLLLAGDVDTYFRLHLRFPAWHLVQWPDRSGFYGGETALLMTVALPFFLLGMAWAFSRGWRLPGAMLVLWLAGTVLGNSLMRSPLESARYVVAFPALIIATTLGWRLLAQTVQAVGVPRRVVNLATAILLVALVGVQVAYYFRVHAPYYMLDHTDATVGDDINFRVVDLPDNTHIHLVTDELIYGREIYTTLEFWGRTNTQIFMTQARPHELTREYLDDRIPGRNMAIFLPPSEVRLSNWLNQYGGWDVYGGRSPYDVPLALDYKLYLDTDFVGP